MSTLFRIFRYSLRMLRGSPGFTLIAVIALALGIGANTAIFSVVNAVLLRSLPFQDPASLALIYMSAPSKGLPRFELAAADYLDIRAGSHSFSRMGQFFTDNVNIAGKELPQQIAGAFVTIGTLDLLGVQPQAGHLFSKEEGKYGSHRVAILSDALWRADFAASPNVLGKSIDFDGEKYTIVGIMPPSFEFPNSRTQIWAPLRFKPDSEMLTRGNHFMSTIGRLKPGITLQQARAEVQRQGQQLARDHKENEGVAVDAVNLREDRVGDVRKTLWVLLGAVSLVLLIACANVANLLLARAASRQKEIGMRAALGASRWRLVRQFLIESLSLSLFGGLLGVLVALWSIQLIVGMKPANLPGFEHLAIDGPVFAYALAVSLLTGILFGLFPALQISKAGLAGTLKETGRSSTAGTTGGRFRDALVAAEIAISLVLLVGAGLLISTLLRLQNVDPGFRSDHVLSLSLSLPSAKYPKDAQVVEFYRQSARASANHHRSANGGDQLIPSV